MDMIANPMSKVLLDIMQDMFSCDGVAITRATTADDIDGWDSLSHAILLLRIERRLGIRFPRADVAHLDNVGQLDDLIRAHHPA